MIRFTGFIIYHEGPVDQGPSGLRGPILVESQFIRVTWRCTLYLFKSVQYFHSSNIEIHASSII
ncbi:hypothetical protein RSAG8_02665, partial [Rhizoctonia solani AG-8 WAC10335]